MSPASYQTAPPRVASISDCPFRIAHWPAKPAPWRLGQPCLTIRNPQSAIARAGNGTRTRDPNLGKVVLYQLSYSRRTRLTARTVTSQHLLRHVRVRAATAAWQLIREDGGEGNRTPDLVNAIHALSQLSYAPEDGRVRQKKATVRNREV